jgi:Fe-S-cluster containining protein
MIKQFVPEEACLHCQGCCRFVQEDSSWVPSLLNEEIEHFLNQGAAVALITPQKKLKIVPFPKQKVYLCSLFNYEENKCKVYDSRPLECQLYPFLLCAKGKEVYLAADSNCPFLKEKNKTREFKEYSQYLISLLQNPPYAELLRNNPHIIQPYAEVREIQALSL